MPLPTNLTTNEVKDRTGTELEFLFKSEIGSSREYYYASEQPAFPFRIKVQHRDVGSPGVTLKRQSNVLTTKKVAGQVDTSRVETIRFSTSGEIPQGNLTDLNAVADTLAAHISFIASNGADTAVKFDCTGTGSAALKNGTL